MSGYLHNGPERRKGIGAGKGSICPNTCNGMFCFGTFESGGVVEFSAESRGRRRVLQKSMSQANKVDHECVSVDSLVQYLKQRCGHQNIQVQREQDDPPDFWLSIDGNRFAVEETSIATEATVKGIAIARKKGSTFGRIGSKWEGEAQDEVAELIQGAVSSKRSKLEKKGVPQQCRDIILLLYDAYGYGDAEDAKIALRNVHGYDWFHSVFWAASFTDRPNQLYPDQPGRVGFFLYTKEDGWKG
jgi:hypothetical protein